MEPPASQSKFSVAVAGAGRLGARLARRLRDVLGVPPPLWSRRFDGGFSDSRLAGGDDYHVVTWEELFDVDVVLMAIPGSALVGMRDRVSALRGYGGVVASANLDARLEDLQRLAPNAHIVRFAPFLLAGRSDIPSLITQAVANDPRWCGCGRAVMATLGPWDMVDSELAYESLLIFGSPYPTVLYHGIRSAFQLLGDDHKLSDDQRVLGEWIFWRAIGAMASDADTKRLDEVAETVATPGGVTAEGLANLNGFTAASRQLADIMLRHSQRLREKLKS